jgi:hypothetical protein
MFRRGRCGHGHWHWHESVDIHTEIESVHIQFELLTSVWEVPLALDALSCHCLCLLPKHTSFLTTRTPSTGTPQTLIRSFPLSWS